MRRPNATLAPTSRCGNSAWSWNMSPTPRRCGGRGRLVDPVEGHGAGVERLQAGDGAQEGRLAAAARAEDGDDLAGRNLEVDVGERRGLAEPNRHAGQGHPGGHTQLPRAPGRGRQRSTRSTALAVSTIRTVLNAKACPVFRGPGRPSSRAMVTGTVGASARAITVVAPNSPSEIANANPAATSTARRTRGRSMASHVRARRGAEHCGRVVEARIDRAEHRRHRVHDERERDHGLGDRDEPRAGAQVHGFIERDEEAEADRDGRGPQRDQQHAVDEPRDPPLGAGQRGRGHPTEHDRDDRGHGGEADRVGDGLEGRDEEPRARIDPRQRPPCRQAVPVAGPEGALDQRGEREPEEQRQGNEVGADPQPLASTGRATAAARARGRRRWWRADVRGGPARRAWRPRRPAGGVRAPTRPAG